MTAAYQYALAHWGQAMALLAFLLTILGTIRNALTYLGYARAVNGFTKVLDVLAWIAEHGKSGVFGPFNVPLVPSLPPKGAAPPSLQLLLVGLVFAGVAGCASAQYDTMVGEYTLARAEGLGIKAFNEVDKKQMAGFYDQYTSGDHVGAVKSYLAYKPKQQRALSAFNSADHLMHAADEVRDGAVKGARDWKDFYSYLPQFVAAAQNIFQSLSELGIHIGGGK